MSDFPPQSHPTTVEVCNLDLEKVSSGPSTLNARNSFNDEGMAGMIWVFTWSEIVNYFLQTVGLVAGVVFGVWAIRTYNATKTSLVIATTANRLSTRALTQSRLANQLGLITFCASIQTSPPSDFTTPCSTISKSLLSTVMEGVVPVSSEDLRETPLPSSKATAHFAIIVGIIVAVVVLFVTIGAFLLRKKRLRISVRIN